MSIPPFLGVVGVKKWSPFLDFGARSPIFGHLKMGTYAENGGKYTTRFLVCIYWDSLKKVFNLSLFLVKILKFDSDLDI